MPKYQTVLILNYILLNYYFKNGFSLSELFKKSIVSFNEEIGEISFGVLNRGLKNFSDFSNFPAIVKKFKLLALYKEISYDFKDDNFRQKSSSKTTLQLLRAITKFKKYFKRCLKRIKNKKYKCYKAGIGKLNTKRGSKSNLYYPKLNKILFYGVKFQHEFAQKLIRIGKNMVWNSCKFDSHILNSILICDGEKSFVSTRDIKEIFHEDEYFSSEDESMSISSSNDSSSSSNGSSSYSDSPDIISLYNHFDVEEVLSSNMVDNEEYFYVKWVDYSDDFNEWIKGTDMDGCQTLINEYYELILNEDINNF